MSFNESSEAFGTHHVPQSYASPHIPISERKRAYQFRIKEKLYIT